MSDESFIKTNKLLLKVFISRVKKKKELHNHRVGALPRFGFEIEFKRIILQEGLWQMPVGLFVVSLPVKLLLPVQLCAAVLLHQRSREYFWT